MDRKLGAKHLIHHVHLFGRTAGRTTVLLSPAQERSVLFHPGAGLSPPALFNLDPIFPSGIFGGDLPTTLTLASAEDAILTGIVQPPTKYSSEVMHNNAMIGYAITQPEVVTIDANHYETWTKQLI
jgi:hypothetical protein